MFNTRQLCKLASRFSIRSTVLPTYSYPITTKTEKRLILACWQMTHTTSLHHATSIVAFVLWNSCHPVLRTYSYMQGKNVCTQTHVLICQLFTKKIAVSWLEDPVSSSRSSEKVYSNCYNEINEGYKENHSHYTVLLTPTTACCSPPPQCVTHPHHSVLLTSTTACYSLPLQRVTHSYHSVLLTSTTACYSLPPQRATHPHYSVLLIPTTIYYLPITKSYERLDRICTWSKS